MQLQGWNVFVCKYSGWNTFKCDMYEKDKFLNFEDE